MDRVFDDAVSFIDEMQADETKAYIEEEDTAPTESISTEILFKERKIRLKGNMKIDNCELLHTSKRSRKIPSLVDSTSAYRCMTLVSGLDLQFNKQDELGVENKANFVTGDLLNTNNPVLLL